MVNGSRLSARHSFGARAREPALRRHVWAWSLTSLVPGKRGGSACSFLRTPFSSSQRRRQRGKSNAGVVDLDSWRSMTSPGGPRPVPVDGVCRCEAGSALGLKASKAEEVVCPWDHTQSDTGVQTLRDARRTWSRLGKEGRWSAKSWSQDSGNGWSGSCNGQTKRALGRDQAEGS